MLSLGVPPPLQVPDREVDVLSLEDVQRRPAGVVVEEVGTVPRRVVGGRPPAAFPARRLIGVFLDEPVPGELPQVLAEPLVSPKRRPSSEAVDGPSTRSVPSSRIRSG